MNILLDECLPRKLKFEIKGHQVITVPEQGWAGTKNGALLRLAENNFDCFITADQNVRYQQNLIARRIAIIVLVARDNRFDPLQPLVPQILMALQSIKPGKVVHINDAD